jgi:hypothetical protein
LPTFRFTFLPLIVSCVGSCTSDRASTAPATSTVPVPARNGRNTARQVYVPFVPGFANVRSRKMRADSGVTPFGCPPCATGMSGERKQTCILNAANPVSVPCVTRSTYIGTSSA